MLSLNITTAVGQALGLTEPHIGRIYAKGNCVFPHRLRLRFTHRIVTFLPTQAHYIYYVTKHYLNWPLSHTQITTAYFAVKNHLLHSQPQISLKYFGHDRNPLQTPCSRRHHFQYHDRNGTTTQCAELITRFS